MAAKIGVSATGRGGGRPSSAVVGLPCTFCAFILVIGVFPKNHLFSLTGKKVVFVCLLKSKVLAVVDHLGPSPASCRRRLHAVAFVEVAYIFFSDNPATL